MDSRSEKSAQEMEKLNVDLVAAVENNNIPLITVMLNDVDKQYLYGEELQTVRNVLSRLAKSVQSSEMKTLLNKSLDLLVRKQAMFEQISNPDSFFTNSSHRLDVYISYFPKAGHPTPNFYEEALLFACKRGIHAAVKILLDAGVDVNSPYYSKCWTSNLMARAILNGDQTLLVLLLAGGADVNCQFRGSFEMQTPLMLAVNFGELSMVQLLLAYKADVNRKTTDRDNTALHFIHRLDKNLSKHQNAIPILQELLNAGANVDACTDFYGSPLNVISESREGGNAAKLLIEAGANVNLIPSRGGSVLINAVKYNHTIDLIKLILAKGAEINYHNKQGESALRVAIETGRDDVVTLLITAGADFKEIFNGKTLIEFSKSRSITRILQTAIDNEHNQTLAADIFIKIKAAYTDLSTKQGADLLHALAFLQADEAYYKKLISHEPELDDATLALKAHCLSMVNVLLNDIKAIFVREYPTALSLLSSFTAASIKLKLMSVGDNAISNIVGVADSIYISLKMDPYIQNTKFYSEAMAVLDKLTLIVSSVVETPARASNRGIFAVPNLMDLPIPPVNPKAASKLPTKGF